MNKNIIIAAIVLIIFSTWFNPALTHATFDKTPNSHSKPVLASSNTIIVPDNYTTIQEAINNANQGDTIFVKAGTYYEQVSVYKALSLVGENKHNTTIDGGGNGTVVFTMTSAFTLSNFTIQNGEYGIWSLHSTYNTLTNNIVSNNEYGIYLKESSDNTLYDNIASNNTYGIYLYSSGHNNLTGNTVSNNEYGIYVWGSSNNILSGNQATNNSYGFDLETFSNNILSGNEATNNRFGIYLYSSGYNTLIENTVSNNMDGIHARGYSSNNTIFHNNFVNNTEPPSSINLINSWDNGVEGNYWSDYTGKDLNGDGIGDTPYYIDERRRDNYPLMAMFQQFNIATGDQLYKIATVCNSTISNFQYRYDSDTKTGTVDFKVNDTEGKGFCRIGIPHALIVPPYAVAVDNNSPLDFKIAYMNGTHTWLYFTYDPSEHEVTIIHTSSPEQLLWSRWTIFGLAIIVVILFSISINYYRLFNKQKKVIEAYEREVGNFPVSHEERARMRFIKDVIEREEKLEEFKKKYGIKIQPACTLEDLMEKLGVQKKANH